MLKIPKYLPLAIMLLLLISFNNIVNANILNRSVISAGGGNVTAGNETLIYTFGQPFILPIPQPPLQTGFLFPLSSGGEPPKICGSGQCQPNKPCVCFVIEKNQLETEDSFFKVQERLTIKLDIRVVQENRWDRVDLYVAYQFPYLQELLFLNELSTMLPVVTPYLTNLEQTTTQYTLLDTEVPPCFGGQYGLFAAFVQKDGNPMEAYNTNGFVSNLAHKTIELENWCNE